MDLVGIKVKHKLFGVGVVVEQIGRYMTVEFVDRTTKFLYPDAFDKFIRAEDEEIHTAIIASIEEATTVAKHQLQVKEVERKAADERRRAAMVVSSSKAKKSKTIDEMFSEDYHVEKLAREPTFTYQQVEDQFGIRIAGFGRGINQTETTVVLISSIGRSGDRFVYHDKWTSDGEYIYSGEGKTGNQMMTKGNLAIKNAASDGKTIHLFVKFSPQKYCYQGVFELVDFTYEDEQDESGSLRKEYKFRLRKVINE